MKFKELIIGAAAGILGGYLIDKWLKSRKKSFAGVGNVESLESGEQTVQFTISNMSDSSQQINLFDSYINYVNPNVSITPSMQTFNTYLPRQPMKVKSIQIQSQGTLITNEDYLKYAEAVASPAPTTPTPPTTPPTMPNGMDVEEYLKYGEAVGLTQSQSAAVAFNGNWRNFDVSNAQNLGNGYYLVKDKQNAQANQTFTKVCTDASGNESKKSITPTISPLQAQSGNTIIKPKKLILDGKCYLTYTILPKQYLFITMTYEQYEVK